MKSQLIVLAVLAVAPLILADIDLRNVRPAEDPKVESRPVDGRDFIGDLIGNIRRKVAAPHIVGGAVVEPHSYPHQVALIILTPRGQSMCGGSLIDPDWVLTAAHCAENVQAITAVLGSHNLSQPEPSRQIIPARRILSHKSWNRYELTNDIALLKLSKPATLTEYVKTIRLPAASQRGTELADKSVEVVGWGKYTDQKLAISPALRGAETKTITNDQCNLTYNDKIKNSHICADGSEAKGVCNGDSGGPMILTEDDGQRTVIGITSFGRREGCEKFFPTVFTRVDYYLDWIARNTGMELRN